MLKACATKPQRGGLAALRDIVEECALAKQRAVETRKPTKRGVDELRSLTKRRIEEPCILGKLRRIKNRIPAEYRVVKIGIAAKHRLE